ncbi:DsbA family protein [Crossiella cryophila]|uniref:Protein-disulfide isomerase n=1 Tax=Crossiella cryophila TaxID=43355 RepID=A0A7W7CI58_9PSEU|nr:thioredoxin domain-containing protein [Crossiella cryophila]MBB4681585.1 protein-disulfide isomerase [Crossiella cryophila]
MSANARISLVVIAVVAAVVTALFVFNRPNTPAPAAQPAPAGTPSTAPAEVLVRPNSHKLSTAPDGKVTVVEFLDLECEACRAAYPGVERLRAEYAGKVTFVLRYFPIPSHRNAELAARAVEAASKQGKLEPMYQGLYETQAQWGEQQTDQRGAFLDLARRIGLDLPTFERDLDDPATQARVLADRADGTTLGVRGTPTFFVNGAQYTGRPSYEGLKSAIDAALAK